MPPQPQSPGTCDEQLAVVDGRIARPFPDEHGRPGASSRWSGHGFHLAVLRENQDVWEDRSTEAVVWPPACRCGGCLTGGDGSV
ncbi:hypothetical protein [Actinacidiphila bryophytorum]|uniref:hypothetical protein n=1 Tax=Actinacidiphila bryophytorum TaxID=1436133 RepID=UPI00195F582A|nr:hypothetical protein [Actinacidiphila bryophytorum]MBM9439366.1 hypothetical protein [Actinacidiphila bryophytorum]